MADPKNQEEQSAQTAAVETQLDSEFDNEIARVLVDGGYVAAEDMKNAVEFSQSAHASLKDYLIAQELITNDILGQAVAEALGVTYADLNSNPPSKDDALQIPEGIARKYRAVFYTMTEDSITIATDDPTQEDLAIELKQQFPGKEVTLAYSLPEDIDQVLVYYRKDLEVRFLEIIENTNRIAPEIIEEILEDALALQCSDVHFEPFEEEVIIRFRIDGLLEEVGRIPFEYYENILNRIKVEANLRIDEHFAAQDGAIRAKKQGKDVDMRISIVPTLDGEKVVIRILSEHLSGLSFAELGLNENDQVTLSEAAKKPFGMILVTGPTGSGKTTTLYSVLKLKNDPRINITTIEDPVEYKIPGVNHIQVNPKTNLTFAKGLRSIVRQDPDVILVGEIRDKETAEISVNAALTGHLLFSTFHANDASTAIPRLIDMGVEPFLVSSTLELIISQRLVRRLCETCRFSFTTTKEELSKLYPTIRKHLEKDQYTLYKAKGCKVCNGTGFRGRIGVYEFLPITDDIREMIIENPSGQAIWEMGKKAGGHSLFQDGLLKVKNGITTFEELLRVVPFPDEEEAETMDETLTGPEPVAPAKNAETESEPKQDEDPKQTSKKTKSKSKTKKSK